MKRSAPSPSLSARSRTHRANSNPLNRLIGDAVFPNLTGYDLRPQIDKPLVFRDPQRSLINDHRMVDWYTANEPAPLGQSSTFTTYPFFRKHSELLPAGLIGPVRVVICETPNKRL